MGSIFFFIGRGGWVWMVNGWITKIFQRERGWLTFNVWFVKTNNMMGRVEGEVRNGRSGSGSGNGKGRHGG